MRAHGLGAGAVPQIMVFEILNFGFRKGAAPIGRRLLTHWRRIGDAPARTNGESEYLGCD